MKKKIIFHHQSFLFVFLLSLSFLLYGCNEVMIPTTPSEVLENPVLSHAGGFYEESFYLEIETDPTYDLYYTLDSSEPTRNSILYTEPIFIEKKTIEVSGSPLYIQNTGVSGQQINDPAYPISMIVSSTKNWVAPSEDLFGATVVKVKSFDSTENTSKTMTNTYFVDENMMERYSFPIISISTDIDHLFDYEEGINVPGKYYDASIPETGADNRTGNFFESGDAWERPMHMEYFNLNGEQELSQQAGIRIHGGLSRKYAVKSYRLYARSEYDEQSAFNYQFFEDKETELFKRIILRAGGQTYSYTFMGEAAAQSLLKPLDLDIQYSTPVILFMNGEYFGIRNIRDRLDTWHLSIEYDLNPDNITILTGYAYLDDGSSAGQSHYRNVYRYINVKDMERSYHYDYVSKRIDLDNFTDYYISQIYFANADWPQNNVLYWRYNTSYDKDAPSGKDGRWRFMINDVDAGFAASWGGNYPEYDMFERLSKESWKTGDLLMFMLDNEKFKADFINRFADLLNTVFSSEIAQGTVEEMRALYEVEMEEHIKRWGYPTSYIRWQAYVDNMKSFAKERPENLIEQLTEEFDLKGMSDITLNSDQLKGYIQVNRLNVNDTYVDLLDGSSWAGRYFNGIPVKLKAIPLQGYHFAGWFDENDHLMSGDIELDVDPADDIELTAVFAIGDPIVEEDALSVTTILIYASVFVISSLSITYFIMKRKIRA